MANDPDGKRKLSFTLMDQNGDGFLSLYDLKAIFVKPQDAEYVMEKADQDHDKLINLKGK